MSRWELPVHRRARRLFLSTSSNDPPRRTPASYGEDDGITGKPTGVAYPVVILVAVTLVMTYLARRRRFGRYVYANGGNPKAAISVASIPAAPSCSPSC